MLKLGYLGYLSFILWGQCTGQIVAQFFWIVFKDLSKCKSSTLDHIHEIHDLFLEARHLFTWRPKHCGHLKLLTAVFIKLVTLSRQKVAGLTTFSNRNIRQPLRKSRKITVKLEKKCNLINFNHFIALNQRYYTKVSWSALDKRQISTKNLIKLLEQNHFEGRLEMKKKSNCSRQKNSNWRLLNVANRFTLPSYCSTIAAMTALDLFQNVSFF